MTLRMIIKPSEEALPGDAVLGKDVAARHSALCLAY